MRNLMAAMTVGTALLPASALATVSSVPFIYADQVHAMGITGEGVTVAMIDTGIYFDEHGLLGSIAPGGTSFEGGLQWPDGGYDVYGYGHGTYMSLIITDSSGVAPDANILSIRVFGPYGTANAADVILGIDYARLRRQQVDTSIRVINLSLGGGFYPCDCDESDGVTREYARALSDALAAGIVSFGATGNDACCFSISAPACVSAAMPVAAAYDDYYGFTYFDGEMLCDYECGDYSQPYYVTCFSHWVEDCTALSAPGYDITVGSYWGHGTSQATAHCSGVAALMFERGGCSLTAWQARSIIYNTAYDIWFAYPYCPLPPPPRHVDALAAVLAVAPGCVGDVDCDGDTDHADMGALLAAWCSHEGDGNWNPNADLDRDGHVGHGDLGIVLGDWGCGL
jgi:subtilisin family serine protease